MSKRTVAAALTGGTLVCGALLAAGAAPAQTPVPVGQLATLTGPTSEVAKVYAQGIMDSFAYINTAGGIGGTAINLVTINTEYDTQRAVAAYEEWRTTLRPPAIQGWGTPDTEALIPAVTRDQVVFMSGSASGHLTDPTGRSPWTEIKAPFNFFYGPSYSDGCRGLVQYAADHYNRTGAGAVRSTFLGEITRPKFTFMGDNHPFPNAPRGACIEFARELGFEVMPPIRYTLQPSDFTAQCATLKQQGANYVFLANTADSNVALIKACAAQGVAAQFMTNIYGWDEAAARAAGDAGNGVFWVVTTATWADPVPGMETVRKIAALSDPSGENARPLAYIRGVCAAFMMRDAMATAAAAGAMTGVKIKEGFETMKAHVPAGLEGVCLPSTFTPSDHRGTTTVMVYRSDYNYGRIALQRVFETSLPRRPDWLGW
ncbi:MAG: ABC transporter substrate-binding protein [Rhodospirillales bacterium]|jgi:branched-chain amino acid transport system substrate-binding protein|nr:ABC transporter substrate-binding protein [Rhodospirillales bacterium]